MKLPQIPSHWSWKTVSDLGNSERSVVKAGPFGSALKKEYYVESGFRVYGQEQVIAGDLSIGDYYISLEKYQSLKTCAIEAGDILVSLVGTFGKVLVVPDVFEPGIINPRLVRLSFNSKIIDSGFFCHFFRSPLAQIQMDLHSHGGTMGILNAKNISKLFIPLPPLEEQKRIAAILDKADAIRRKRKKAIRLTEERTPAIDLPRYVRRPYTLYLDVLARLEPERILYLAIRQETFIEVFQDPIGEILLENKRLKLIVFDEIKEEIQQWIT